MTEHFPINCYAAVSHDDAVVGASSSGGAFTEIAKVVLQRGGVVFGAKWDKNTWLVVNGWVDREEKLDDLRGSKYVVSDARKAYSELTSFLDEGRVVLFVGTPCQCAAVRRKFGHRNELIICSLFCQSNAAAKIWQSHLKSIERKFSSTPLSISMRDKSGGWSSGLLVVRFKNGQSYIKSHDRDAYFRAYDMGLSAQTACLHCKFRNGKDDPDIRIGDFWGITQEDVPWNVTRGTSAVLVFTDLGKSILKSSKLKLAPVSFEKVLSGNRHLGKSIQVNLIRRTVFMSLFEYLGVSIAFYIATMDLRIKGVLKSLCSKYRRCFK